MVENRFAPGDTPPKVADYEPASPDQPALALDFGPVPLRYRHDGLTPEKQRDHDEALGGLFWALAGKTPRDSV